jgi:CRISPR-associated protein Csb2
LVAFAFYKIRALLVRGLRLRTACDLAPIRDGLVATAPAGYPLPELRELEMELPQLIDAVAAEGLFAEPRVTTVVYRKKWRDVRVNFSLPGRTLPRDVMGPTCKRGRRGWPPEPYRILRALIATWHRTADPARYDEDALERLIEALAGELPLFGLPDAVNAHTRHYMPQGKLAKGREETKLVFDGFLRISPTARLISVWPATTLQAASFDLAAHLAERMNYFGRAESLVCAHTEQDLAWKSCINSRPDGPTDASTVAVHVLAARSPWAHAAERPGLLALNGDKPKSKKRRAFEETAPVSLFEAVQVETSALQAAGWSQPPGGRFVLYHRPEIGPRAPGRRIRPTPPTQLPKVARLLLAGRPLPRIEDTVKIGEVFRRAVMARIKGEIPAVISGRDADGKASHDPQHSHAFFLPEDHDRDGFIDHLVLYIRMGCPRKWPTRWTICAACGSQQAAATPRTRLRTGE